VDLHKQQYKFIEATGMRFLLDIASYRRGLAVKTKKRHVERFGK
jgi:hypothetical protein